MKKKSKIIDDEVNVIILVCFLLKRLGELTETLLLETVTVDGLVSQFKLNDALTVIENKHFAVPTKKGYRITNEGEDFLSKFEKSIDPDLRDKLIAAGNNAVRVNELKKTARWSISKERDNWVFYACFLNEMDSSKVIEIKLYSKTKEDAETAQNKFLQQPAKVFSECISNFI